MHHASLHYPARMSSAHVHLSACQHASCLTRGGRCTATTEALAALPIDGSEICMLSFATICATATTAMFLPHATHSTRLSWHARCGARPKQAEMVGDRSEVCED
eukprot:362606-Chlamydomonas_euryale.AAC.2